MVATWNPAAASAYYVSGSEYYLGGVEPQGQWYAPAGDHCLADGALVERKHFERLYAALDETGTSLISNAGVQKSRRTPAFDITMSAPRSVSLIWAFADEQLKSAIEAAQVRATRSALDCLTHEAVFARRGRGGHSVEPVALSAAIFQHGESRPAEHEDGHLFCDPNLHSHCVCLNLATRADGTVGALHSKILRDAKLLAGATYHAALAESLQRLGFSLDRVGYNGLFEIAGVPDTAIRYFSARSREIEEELAEHGTTSRAAAALAAAIARSTRKAKSASASPRELIWREAAASQGLAANALLLACRNVDRTIDFRAGEHLFRERLAALPTLLTKTTSVLERRDLLRAVTAQLVGTGLPAQRANAALDDLLAKSAFVEIGRDPLGLPRYSTPEIIAMERNVVRLAGARSTARWGSVDLDAMLERCAKVGLRAEQIEAAKAAVAPQALSIIEGAPGSGKTTTLAPIVAAYQEAGYNVLGSAAAWRIARMLAEDLEIEARATASWLAKVKANPRFFDERTVLIVDEAGLLSSRDMHALLAQAARSGAKLILCGDRDQLQAIGAGPGFALAQSAVSAARVDTIVRQKDAWARDAIRAFGAGRAGEALDAFAERGHLVEAAGPRVAISKVVEAWAHAREASGDSGVVVLAKTNAAVSAISQGIRERLRIEGSLHGPEITISAVTPSGHPQSLLLAVGDRIRFLIRHDRIGVINGTTGVVTRIDPSKVGDRTDEALIEAQIDGRSVKFTLREIADKAGRAKIGLAYASSVYGSQGLTFDQAVVLLDPSFDRHDIYVAASRARERTTLVVDASAIDRRIQLARPDEAAQFTPVDETERRKWLADKLSRASAKLSTIAVMASARESEERTVGTRVSRRFAHER